MKTTLLKYLFLGSMIIGLGSCKKDETQTVSTVTPAGALTASATTVNLVQVNGALPALTLSFPQATVTGYQTPVTAALQFGLKGSNFKTPIEVAVTTTSYTPTVSELNTMLLAQGLPVGTSGELEVRLRSGAAANAMTYSNVVSVTGTPYLASAWIYLPGAYQNWTPATADSLVSLTSNKIYTGVILFPAGSLGFKMTPAKTWDVAYGDAGSGKFSTTGGDFNALTSGLKWITFNLNDNSYKIEDFKGWAVIGDATPTGWEGDTDLKYINDGKGSWKGTVNLKVGELKFREDKKWDNNYGLKDGAFTNVDAGNIKVTAAGSYTITFTPLFIIESGIKKYSGGSYSIVKN